MNESSPSTVVDSAVEFFSDSRSSTATTRQSVPYVAGEPNSRVGVSNPSYRNQIAQGADASTAYSRIVWNKTQAAVVEFEAKTPDQFVKQMGYSISTEFSGRLHGQPQFLSMDYTETRNRALARIKKEVGERTQQAKALVPLGEAKELGRLVDQGCKLIGAAIIAIADAKRRKSGKPLRRFISQTWLGLNFGLLPLIKDIDNVGKAVAKMLDRDDVVVRVTGSASADAMGSYSVAATVSPPFGCNITGKGAAHKLLQIKYVGGFSLKLFASNDYTGIEQLGLGYTSVPAALWELKGFSWLIDYFVNIGEYLEDAFWSPPGDFTYLVENIRVVDSAVHSYSVDLVRDWTGTSPNGLVQLHKKDGHAVFECVRFTRTPMLVLPRAGLVWKSNQTQGKFAISKLLNLAAVLGK